MDWRNRIGLYGSLLPRHGGHRLHPALPAALPRPAGAVGPDDRPGLDAGGAGGPGAVPGRPLVRPDRLAEAVPGGRAGGAGAGDRAAPRRITGRSVLASWSSSSRRTGSAGQSSRASPAPRPRRWPPRARSARRSGPCGSGSRSGSSSWPWPAAGCRSGTASARSCSPWPWFRPWRLVAALLIHEPGACPTRRASPTVDDHEAPRRAGSRKDPALWAFVAAMVLFHAANAPGGVYLGLFLKRDLHAPERLLAYAFVVSMVAWMLVVWPAGWLADRWGRRPLLIAGWAIMALRLALVAIVQDALAGRRQPGSSTAWATACSRSLAAAWVTDRLADPRRHGRGPGDRRHVAGPRLGARPGGLGPPGRCARLPRPVRRCSRPSARSRRGSSWSSSPRPWRRHDEDSADGRSSSRWPP